MPTEYSATIMFANGVQESLVSLGYAPGFTQVQTFAQTLHQMTTANIIRCTFTQAMDPQLTGPGGDVSDTEFSAHFKLRRTDPNADVKFRSFRIPAPRLEIFEHLAGQGYRIKKTYGDQLATAYTTLMGETFIFDSGWLVK